MMNVGTLSSHQGEFWVTPMWRRGYCPYHTWNHDGRCSVACVQLRADFGAVARETRAYFESVWYLHLQGKIRSTAA